MGSKSNSGGSPQVRETVVLLAAAFGDRRVGDIGNFEQKLFQLALGGLEGALKLRDPVAECAHLPLERLGVAARLDDAADLARALVARLLELLDLDQKAAPAVVKLPESVE